MNDGNIIDDFGGIHDGYGHKRLVGNDVKFPTHERGHSFAYSVWDGLSDLFWNIKAFIGRGEL